MLYFNSSKQNNLKKTFIQWRKKMFKMPETITYAFPEQIGNPDLFVGRKEEFDFFLGDWYMTLEGNFAQNQAIVSRRKKGKNSFLQRLFNILWSAGGEKSKGNLNVIPFYYTISDEDTSLGSFSKDFFTQLICQYTSYKRREKELINGSYEFENLLNIIDDPRLIPLYENMILNFQKEDWKGMWRIASRAPATIGRITGEKIVQIIEESQNINESIVDKDKETINNMSGTYMQVAEVREAPLIVSGSEVHWLLKIVRSLTGRFQTYSLSNLPKNEAKEAVEAYANFMRTKINQQAKEKIWDLTQGDPLYIKALFMSRFNRKKDYTLDENIINVYEKEISQGEIYATWMEYMLNTLCNFEKTKLPGSFHEHENSTNTFSKTNSKRIMLYLFNQGKEKTRAEIIKDLKLPYTDQEAEEKLNALIAGDLISQGSTAYRYAITKDKTYELVFKSVYQDEIDHFVPDIKGEIRKVLGKDNYQKGKFTEFLLKERLKKPFTLNEITENGKKSKIIPIDIEESKIIPTGVGKSEIDLYIRAKSGYELYIDIKNTKSRYGKKETDRWLKIAEYLGKHKRKAIFLVFSQNGYTKGTKERLEKNDIQVLKVLR